ncbi:TetR/AcrR family transcriptional regulator [Curtobacterium sp. MCPF17_018]|uniref:TetR/AcrR family transcriptional regulator n=1 Tax=Curtobacterium sp. MCPF17_018 TaxID=2175638 RepID=UPI000DA92D85|nr:TetR/AcrR family transcriptional regulator [Curtobacterium sp. MCPF17_018]PZE70786.1 TetR/AcrR family transcriptional regulator [Curtobacterium sp. MCPF17_018]
MRESKRTLVLESAARIVESSGITAVTFDSVAVESGLTKGGLLYHFPTREALLEALHEHEAARWEQQLLDALEVPFDTSTREQRLAAYVAVSMRSASTAALMLLLEATFTPTHAESWRTVLNRWTVGDAATAAAMPIDHLIVRLAADGLWMHEATAGFAFDAATREALRERLTELLTRSTETDGDR